LDFRLPGNIHLAASALIVEIDHELLQIGRPAKRTVPLSQTALYLTLPLVARYDVSQH
jgi:hypothetical protein